MSSKQLEGSSASLGVDTHAHIFNQQLGFVHAGEGYIPDYDATLETYLGKLDRYGLSHGVLIQPSFLGDDNSNLLAAVAAHLDRLRAIVIADPDAPREKLEDMVRQGAVGVRLILYGDEEDYGDGRWRRFAETLATMDLIVEAYGPASGLADAGGHFLDAGCRMLLDHYGRPDAALGAGDPGLKRLLRLAETGRVWFDLSGPYRNGAGAAGEGLSVGYFSTLKAAVGLDRLLWGSDWPCVQYEPHENYESAWCFLHRIVPDPAERHELLWSSPARCFGLTAPTAAAS